MKRRFHRAALPGALLVVLLGGCSKPGKESGTTTDAADPETKLVVARVGKTEITARDVTDRIVERSPAASRETYLQNPDVKQITLASILDERVWALAARDAGLDRDPSVERQVDTYRAGLLAQKYVSSVVQPKAKPTEQAVRDYYDAHHAEYEGKERVAVRQIVLASRTDAEGVLGRIKAGEDFATLASQVSMDTKTRALGGSVGYVMRGFPNAYIAGVSGLQDVLFALTPGQVTDVIAGPADFRIFKVERKDPPGLRTLDEVRTDIERTLSTQKYRDVYNEELRDLREKYRAKIDETVFAKYTGVANDPDRLFQTAASTTDAGMRLELYRRIVFDFPQNSRAPEAQFLIGLLSAQTKDYATTDKAFGRLERNYPNSDLVPLARWVRDHMRDPGFAAGSAEDVRRLMGSSH